MSDNLFCRSLRGGEADEAIFIGFSIGYGVNMINNTKEEPMAVKVRIPTPLRKLTNGLDEVSVNGATVSAVLEDLERQYPGIKERICEGDGKLRKFVNLYLNDEDIRFKENLSTTVKESDELSIVPAIAGGAF